MANRYEFYTQVGEGRATISVGYSTTVRNGCFGVRFLDAEGKRCEKMTSVAAPPARGRGKPTPPADFHVEAVKIIARAYAPGSADSASLGWDDALDKVEKTAPDLRPDTMVAYRKAVRIVLSTLATENLRPSAPADITPTAATLFARVWLAGTFKRSNKSHAREFRRKPTTLAFYLRQLSAIWSQFIDLGYVQHNPWKSVRKPQTDKVRKAVPEEAEIDHFFAWVHARYPGWDRLHALLELKAISGCRSKDVCVLRSDQLVGGRVVWTAEQVKQREGRAVLLPEELFARLKRLAGPVFLWEHLIDDLKRFRRSRNRLPRVFACKTVYHVMNNVFREYCEANSDRPSLTPHGLRRRAITLTVTATQSVDATAQAIGLNPATARRYYLDSRRAFDTDVVFRRMADSLLPKKEESR
jgi:hypothetical protein